MPTFRLVFGCLALSSALFIGLAYSKDEQKIKKVQMISTPADSGVNMYFAYCASCHGQDGKGMGPAAGAMTRPPTDLTKLAAKNNGQFPAFELMNTLGVMPDATPAHGSQDMPVWGNIFRDSGQGLTAVHLRIYNLTRYIESIQDPPLVVGRVKVEKPQPLYAHQINPSSGAAMYRAYCASCHGANGSGNGPVASTLKHGAPDITLLAKNNGGRFPSEHVEQILGMNPGAEAHGSKEMPVWGNVFRTEREPRTTVLQRISNLTNHLKSLQVR